VPWPTEKTPDDTSAGKGAIPREIAIELLVE
jgi:hypothetical protein